MLFVPAKISLIKPKMWYPTKAVRKSPLFCSIFVSCVTVVFISHACLKTTRVYESIHTCASAVCNWNPEVYWLNTSCCQNVGNKIIFYVDAYGIFHWNVQLLLVQFSVVFCPSVCSPPSRCGRLCCCGPGGCFKRTCSICAVCTERRWELAHADVT